MSRKKTNMFSMSDWLELQRKFLEDSQPFTRNTPALNASTGPFKNPVIDAMEYWRKSISQFVPEDNTELVYKILEQGKIFYALGEQFIRLLHEINKLDKTRHGWETLLSKQFDEMKNLFSKTGKETGQADHPMMESWLLMPMDTLQRTLSLSSIMPGDLLGDLKQDSLQKVTEKFLSIPGVGYTRESQEQFQEGIQLWNEYQNISREFQQAMCKIGMDAIDTMREKIFGMAKEGKKIRSLREIYDLWIDSNEEAYAAYVHTPEFSRLYGRLTNALMAVKQHGRNIVDEHLGALNVPTYKGIHTLQKRQYDMRLEQKAALKKIEGLEKELSVLQNGIKQSKSTALKVPSTSRRKPANKKGRPAVHVGKRSRKKTTASTTRKTTRKNYATKDNMLLIKI